MKRRDAVTAARAGVASLTLLCCALFLPGTLRAAIAAGAELAVTKSATANSLELGQFLSFTVGVTNLGVTTVSNIVVNDTLPPGLGYSGSTAPPDSPYTPASGAWSVATLAPGEGRVLLIQAQATAAGNFTNYAVLMTSSPADTNAANNVASAGVSVTATQALVLNCSSNITVSATSSNGGRRLF